MKEENLRKIISKSTIETSDDFINNLMNTIEVQNKAKQKSRWWSFNVILLVCSILAILTTGLFYNFLGDDVQVLSAFTNNIPKTPVLLIVTILVLYFLNNMIRLNYYNHKTT